MEEQVAFLASQTLLWANDIPGGLPVTSKYLHLVTGGDGEACQVTAYKSIP